MSTKKRDGKGRILKDGETQRKDGKYEYRYKDLIGKIHSIYSWRLTESDSYPANKRKDLSLREKEEIVRKELEDYQNFEFAMITLNELIQKTLC